MVMLNSGGSAGSGAGANPAVPKDPKEADTAEPGSAIQAPPSKSPPRPFHYSPQAVVMRNAAQSGVPFCDILTRPIDRSVEAGKQMKHVDDEK